MAEVNDHRLKPVAFCYGSKPDRLAIRPIGWSTNWQSPMFNQFSMNQWPMTQTATATRSRGLPQFLASHFGSKPVSVIRISVIRICLLLGASNLEFYKLDPSP